MHELTHNNKTLTVIIPVSANEHISTIQSSANSFKNVDFDGFDENIVYAIDASIDTSLYYNNLILEDNMEILWALPPDTELKQAGAYNAGLREYPNSDYYSFFDIDAIPATNFFKECAQVNANFVSCDRLVSNQYQNSITETIAEEYSFCNDGRRFMHTNIGVYFPASCTGLISGITLRDFVFTEKTSADSELYRYILQTGFSMGYAHDTHYVEDAPNTKEKLYSQRLRWESDMVRTFVKTVGSGNSWKVNIANMFSYLLGMFPIIGGIIALPYMKHVRGYNIITHILFLQYVSLIALAKTINGDEVEWA